MRITPQPAANEVYRLPPPLFDARCRACWVVAAILVLVVASFWSLDLQWARFFSLESLRRMGRFAAELATPALEPAFLRQLLPAALETMAMSVVGTLVAVVIGLLLALPAARLHGGDAARWRAPTRLLLNALRSVPELMWAALLLIAAGLGPLAGTLALAVHTAGVLGRLFAEALENAAPGPAFALRVRGVPEGRVFLYATLPQVLPQLVSYTLYRWENNIRAAAILGVVGAGGLGQLLAFHLGLFQMGETGSVLAAMLLLVALVDGASYAARRLLSR
jgi:phosphonate transport system permease protein